MGSSNSNYKTIYTTGCHAKVKNESKYIVKISYEITDSTGHEATSAKLMNPNSTLEINALEGETLTSLMVEENDNLIEVGSRMYELVSCLILTGGEVYNLLIRNTLQNKVHLYNNTSEIITLVLWYPLKIKHIDVMPMSVGQHDRVAGLKLANGTLINHRTLETGHMMSYLLQVIDVEDDVTLIRICDSK